MDAGKQRTVVGTIAFPQSCQSLIERQIDTNHLVHKAIQSIIIKDCALEQYVWFIGMLLAKNMEVSHDTRMHQGVQFGKGFLV